MAKRLEQFENSCIPMQWQIQWVECGPTLPLDNQ